MKKTKADCCSPQQHPDHSVELKRLNRVAGQVEGVRKMIGERRYCLDILTQLRAARAALHALETNILERHMDACISASITAKDPAEAAKKIAELKDIYRRF